MIGFTMLSVKEIAALVKARDVCEANGLQTAFAAIKEALHNSALDVNKETK